MQGPYYAIPGEINTHQFVLYLADGTALQPSATLAAGDFLEVTDGGAAANVDTLPVTETNGCYSWAQSAAESTAGSIVTMLCSDQTASQTFLDTALQVHVYTLEEVAVKFYVGPFGPGIWYDSTNGSAGTTLGTDGTEDDPANTWANALTLAGKLGINRFYVIGGSTATLTGSVADYEIVGVGEFSDNTVALASQDCSAAIFVNIEITGTQGGSGRAQFNGCLLNGVTSLHCEAIRCGTDGTITFSSNDDHVLNACYSMVAGGGAVTFTLAANVDVGFRHHSGGIELASGAATNNVTVEGNGGLTVAASCTNLTVNVRGGWTITDSGSGTTIVSASSGDVNVTSIGGSTAAANNWQKFMDGGGVAFTVGATNLTVTTCLTNLTESTDDHYKGKKLYFLDNTLAGQESYVQAYDGTTKVITFAQTTDVPANGDLCLLI